jgi:hypothetical protein
MMSKVEMTREEGERLYKQEQQKALLNIHRHRVATGNRIDNFSKWSRKWEDWYTEIKEAGINESLHNLSDR